MRLNGPQRIGIVLSIGWSLYITGQAASQYLEVESFYGELDATCPTLTEKRFVRWFDAKSGKAITIYHEGERSLNCQQVADRVNALTAQARAGVIEPTVSIDYKYLLLDTFGRLFLLWAAAYFIVWLVKWIARGFRNDGNHV